MINLSENLAKSALLRTPGEQRALSNQLAAFSNSLSESVAINWDSGAVKFNEPNVRAAAEELQGATAFAVGAAFPDDLVMNLQGGIAVLDRERQDAVPWAALRDPAVINRLSIDRLQKLGVSLAPADTVRAEINTRFSNVPSTIDEAVTANLVDALRERRVMATVEENQTRLAGILPQRPRDGNGGDGGGGGGGGGGVGTTLLDLAKAVPDFVSQCMPYISPTTTSVSVGLGLCFNEDCAWKLQRILMAGGAPSLSAVGAAAAGAISGGLSAAVTAAIAAVGGWVAFIVAICVIIFSGWFASCITSDGACIHFPWWAGFGPIPFARRL